MIPVLAFDIETVPDVEGVRRLHALDESLPDEEVAEFAFQRRRASTGNDFLPLHLQRVIVVSCVLREDRGLRIWSLAEPDSDESGIIQRFFEGIEKYTPQLVSWNGGGFDLPVLHYRGLIHGVRAARYWELGDEDREFRFNNYISRYHQRHLDLMDLLALYQPRANAPLDELAKLMRLPGKLGMDGSAVWSAYRRGEIRAIRDYCETDALNTYLVYLRFQLMRGAATAEATDAELAAVRDHLAALDAPHWREFLAAWK
ncbi:MAG: 3'-5' exonuclease [Rhodocyclaceae bacterium]